MHYQLKNLKRYAANLFLAIVICGCSTSTVIVKSLTGDKESLAHSGTGYVFGSIVSRNESYDPKLKLAMLARVMGAFYSIENTKNINFIIDTGPIGYSKDSISENGGMRRLVLLPIKPGKYKLGHIEGNLYIYHKIINRDMVDSPVIEVREGEITYVGCIKFITNVGKGALLGQPLPASATIALQDEYINDLSTIKSLDSRLSEFIFSNALTKKEN